MLQLDNLPWISFGTRQYAPIIHTVQLLHRNPQIFRDGNEIIRAEHQNPIEISTDNSLKNEPVSRVLFALGFAICTPTLHPKLRLNISPNRKAKFPDWAPNPIGLSTQNGLQILPLTDSVLVPHESVLSAVVLRTFIGSNVTNSSVIFHPTGTETPHLFSTLHYINHHRNILWQTQNLCRI